MITPTICIIVSSRYTQSSVSYAEANQLKPTQAQHTKSVAHRKPVRPAATCPSASRWASSDAATPNATTKVRSKSNSRGVATRWGSSGSRPDIGRSRCVGADMSG